MCLFFFFFKQKTAYEIGTGDWSSDVCSSDLTGTGSLQRGGAPKQRPGSDPSHRDRVAAEGRSPEAAPTQDRRGHFKAPKFGQCCCQISEIYSSFSQLSEIGRASWRERV